MNLDSEQKAIMFDDAMAEFKKSIKLAKNKFGLIDLKMEDIKTFTKDFHESTDKLEKLYLKDIEKRKKYFHEHERLQHDAEGPDLDLSSIDEIFDDIEAQENIPPMMILFKIPNLLMLGVIFMCSMLYMQL